MENQFHQVDVYAVGELRSDNVHYFTAFFRDKADALSYLSKHKLSLFNLSYSILQSEFDKNGDFFVMK